MLLILIVSTFVLVPLITVVLFRERKRIGPLPSTPRWPHEHDE